MMPRSEELFSIRKCCMVAVLAFCVGIASAKDPSATTLVERFQHHIDYLASDELEGRGIGSKGIELAAEYIAGQFKEAGLEPGGENGTYFQTFPIALRRTLSDTNRLSFRGDEAERKQGRDFIPLSFSSSGAFQGKIAFCGYAIVNPDRNHNDFARGDVSGKVALILDGEPADWADPRGNPTRHSFRREKLYNVKDRGAIAAMFVSPRLPIGEEDSLTPFESEGADDYGLPAIQIKREIAIHLVQTSGGGQLDELQKLIDAGHCVSTVLAHAEVSGEVRLERETAPTRNVIGVRRGEGPLAEEFVVIGAHYDHLGVRRPMMRRFKEGRLVTESTEPQIHNGADDNASGVSGLIEIARMFASQPRAGRSILFIAFTAEETGLQGSRHYMENPFAPANRTAAMLNMDMIGRLGTGEERVTVMGARSAREFPEILEAAGKVAGLGISPGVDSGGRSDHAVFSRAGIPSMHFFSGNHADYHKPTDDSDRINADGGARITTVVFETARALATREGRPTPQAEKPEPKAADPHAALGDNDPDKLPTFRVVMGLSPSYADDGKPGMGVDAVSPEGPADRAGMKAGDRIIRIGGKSIANIYDYMASTRNNNPGDVVEVVVLREGKEQTLKVTLSSAR